MAALSAARCDRLAPPCGLVRGRPGSDVDRDLSARRSARHNAADPDSRDVIRKAEAVPKRRLRPQGMAEAQSKAELDLRGFEALPGKLADQGAVQALARPSYSSARVDRSAAFEAKIAQCQAADQESPASVELKTVPTVHLPDRSRTVVETAGLQPSRLFGVAAGAAQTYGAPLKKKRSAPWPSSPTPSTV